jgi:hypothetical protein
LPLLERVRVEVYIPDPSLVEYDNLLKSFEAEFTYAFGGCTILRGLEGCYLSLSGNRIHDRVNVIYSDIPLALSIEPAAVAGYVGEVKRAATEALAEEVVMVAVSRIYHSV